MPERMNKDALNILRNHIKDTDDAEFDDDYCDNRGVHVYTHLGYVLAASKMLLHELELERKRNEKNTHD